MSVDANTLLNGLKTFFTHAFSGATGLVQGVLADPKGTLKSLLKTENLIMAAGAWFLIYLFTFIISFFVLGEELTGEELTGEELTGEELTGEELTGEELTGEEPGVFGEVLGEIVETLGLGEVLGNPKTASSRPRVSLGRRLWWSLTWSVIAYVIIAAVASLAVKGADVFGSSADSSGAGAYRRFRAPSTGYTPSYYKPQSSYVPT